MKAINSNVSLKIPKDVSINIDARIVTVKGPLGVVTKDFKHLAIEITKPSASCVNVAVWFGVRKHLACVRTVVSHISNMIKGVCSGYTYRMKACSTHFPIKLLVAADGASLEIRNFLGEKIVRRIAMQPGCKVVQGEKDEVCITGIDIDKVSLTASTVQQSCVSRNKDVRKFLDGVYCSHRGITEPKQ